MPSIEVRPFQRADRDQLAELVNAHVADWLRLARVERLLDVTIEGEHDPRFARRLGFRELTRARRAWRLSPAAAAGTPPARP